MLSAQNIVLLTVNLWDYDILNAPPLTHDDVHFCYVTDNEDNISHLYDLGWNSVILFTDWKDIPVNNRRRYLSHTRTHPEKLFPELEVFDYLFLTDSNVVSIRLDYFNSFIDNLNQNSVLWITHGYYSRNRNNIEAELEVSCSAKRWTQYREGMISSNQRYLKFLEDENIDKNDVPVCSAKYTIWNLKHPEKDTVAKWVNDEYAGNIQGNIILSVSKYKFPDLIESVNISWIGGSVIGHKKHY